MKLSLIFITCVIFHVTEVVLSGDSKHFTAGETQRNEKRTLNENEVDSTIEKRGGNAEECVSGVYDAITRTSDGYTYAFKGSMVSKLTPSGNYVAPGYPKAICSVFVGLPSDLDAALYWADTDKTYFFKGCQYYRFSGTTLDSGYPKSISANWGGVPCDIDAAIVWGRNGRTYFYKGSVYYRYNTGTNHIDNGYPSSFGTNNRWRGVPSPINAAFQWKNGKTYFFYREQYYRYNDGNDRVDSGYPLITTEEWLGCEKSSPLSEPTKDMCYFA